MDHTTDVFLCLLASSVLLVGAVLSANEHKCNVTVKSRCNFPEGFVFGAASAAYQYEGAAALGGRTPSIWDTFAHTTGKIRDGTTGDLAADGYHRYREDIQYLKAMGMDAYRFSISWSRLMPDGGDNVNPEGLAFYNAVIDELLMNGIEPHVTIYHWDLPQALYDSFGGWLSEESIVPYFVRFAKTCFAAFGDRVKHWVTLNEPNIEVRFGYQAGLHAPGRCSVCGSGHSEAESYVVAHNLLLAHAAASEVYKNEYQMKQGGKIGIIILAFWYEPASPTDVQAAQYAMDFELGWIADPIFFGDYPSSMRNALGEKLPVFTAEQRRSLMNSIDFLGINHYSSLYAQSISTSFGYATLAMVAGVPIGPAEASDWFHVVPWGFKKLLNYIQKRYRNPPVYVYEQGREMFKNATINDETRIQFFHDYLSYMLAAMEEGADIRGYFVWSFLDGWEWSRGYAFNFGLYYVDYADNLKRYQKQSALWFTRFLEHNCTLRAVS